MLRDRPLLVHDFRTTRREEQDQAYLFIQDLVTGQEVVRLGTGFSFVSAFVNGDELNLFATENTNDVEQLVFPTFPVVIGWGRGSALGDIGSFNPALRRGESKEQAIAFAMGHSGLAVLIWIRHRRPVLRLG